MQKIISYYNDKRLLLKILKGSKDEHLRFVSKWDIYIDNNQARVFDISRFMPKSKVVSSKKGIES